MSERVRVNPIACEAHGMCAELLPERISLDEWGYPIVDERPLPPELVSHARRAVQACPTFALLVEQTARRIAPSNSQNVHSRQAAPQSKRLEKRPDVLFASTRAGIAAAERPSDMPEQARSPAGS